MNFTQIEQEVVDALKNSKGSKFIWAEMETEVPRLQCLDRSRKNINPAWDPNDVIKKHSLVQVFTGFYYGNTKEAGTIEDTHHRKYVSIPSACGYNTFFELESGEKTPLKKGGAKSCGIYIQLKLVSGNVGINAAKVSYTLNGAPTTPEELLEMGKISNATYNSTIENEGMRVVHIENIVHISRKKNGMNEAFTDDYDAEEDFLNSYPNGFDEEIPSIDDDVEEQFEIQETNDGKYQIWDEKAGALLGDENGEDLVFDTEEEAEEYLNPTDDVDIPFEDMEYDEFDYDDEM